MARRRRNRAGGQGLLLLILGLIGVFLLLRSDPALASKLPTEARKIIESIKLPSGIPNIQLPTGIPSIQLPGNTNNGTQTKTSGCQAANSLPDSACTPGNSLTGVTLGELCQPGYASSVRDVSESLKNTVYEEYGITSQASGEYEIDHLISLELGGSNDISNLWPQAAKPQPGFHEKDKVENYLHDQVCSGVISLVEAQHEIATNWLAVYNQMPK